jgi:hypothetical protein
MPVTPQAQMHPEWAVRAHLRNEAALTSEEIQTASIEALRLQLLLIRRRALMLVEQIEAREARIIRRGA